MTIGNHYKIGVSFNTSGLERSALYNPQQADRIMKKIESEMMDDLAVFGYEEIRVWMDVFFKTQTPYYATKVTWDRAGRDRVIHDQGVIYGPWLDGSGSRNATSRFKGYPHWRRTKQYLDGPEAQRIVDRYERILQQRFGL